MGNIHLFCLPYAGGAAAVYNQWKQHLHSSIDLHPVELAGRGKRFATPFYESMMEAVEDIYLSIKKYLDDAPYALFGHSMGSLMIFELYHKIKENGHQLPVHMFLSGRYPPDVEKKDEKTMYLLPDKEFMDEILKLGGTPREFLEHKELLELFIPIMRADYKILETYEYKRKPLKINCNITVLGGISDENVTSEDLNKWKNHAGGLFDKYEFDGGHFFINEQKQDIISIINNKLTEYSLTVPDSVYDILFGN